MSTALWFDVLLACLSCVLGFFLSFGARKASTKAALIVSIILSLALLITDRVVWADTGKGLLDHATCLAMPQARSCGGTEAAPSTGARESRPAASPAAGTAPVRGSQAVIGPVAPAAKGPGRTELQTTALALLKPGRRMNPTEVSVAMARAQVGESPRDPDLWHQLGEALTVAGNLQEATTAFERATKLPPKVIGRAYLYRDLAGSLEAVGDVEGALAAARVSLRTWPLTQDGLFCTGAEVQLVTRLLIKLHRLKEAADFYHAIFERHTDHSMTCGEINDALAAAAR